MNCFNHAGKPAVGICRMCGKALCLECTTEPHDEIVCVGECKRKLDEMNRLFQRQTTGGDFSPRMKRVQGVLWILVGASMTILGVWRSNPVFTASVFFAILGPLLILLGITCFKSAKAKERNTECSNKPTGGDIQ